MPGLSAWRWRARGTACRSTPSRRTGTSRPPRPARPRRAPRPEMARAAAGEPSGMLQLAQRLRRGPAEEEKPAEAQPEKPAAPELPESPLRRQSQADADKKSAGCMTCHSKTDSQSMHTSTAVKLGCIDCHGGNNDVRAPDGASLGSPAYDAAKKQAHPVPRDPKLWKTAA